MYGGGADIGWWVLWVLTEVIILLLLWGTTCTVGYFFYCGVLTEAIILLLLWALVGTVGYYLYCGVLLVLWGTASTVGYYFYCGVLTEAINTSDEEEGAHLEPPPLGDQR